MREVELAGARLAGPWRYWDQYVRYQRLAGRQTATSSTCSTTGTATWRTRLPPARTVVTFHDAVVLRVADVSRLTRRSLRYSLRAIARVGRVVSGSHAAREDFLSLVDYPPDRVSVVYPGVDPAFRPAADRDAVRRRSASSVPWCCTWATRSPT